MPIRCLCLDDKSTFTDQDPLPSRPPYPSSLLPSSNPSRYPSFTQIPSPSFPCPSPIPSSLSVRYSVIFLESLRMISNLGFLS